jgi:hypothetical protein
MVCRGASLINRLLLCDDSNSWVASAHCSRNWQTIWSQRVACPDVEVYEDKYIIYYHMILDRRVYTVRGVNLESLLLTEGVMDHKI